MRRVLLLAYVSAALLTAQKWKMQYFHDEDKSSLTITGLKFMNATDGVACGVLHHADRPRPQGVVLVTRNGGKDWDTKQVSEMPISLQFVDASLGFMVTNGGIWKTEERGLTWKKLKGVSGIARVHFLNAERGFAVGNAKQAIETSDGGRTWKPIEALKKVTANPQFTSFQDIAFNGPNRGIIVGRASPPRRDNPQVPAWADPEAAEARREWPALSVTMETTDGGNTWTPQTAPVFGRIVRVMFFNQGLYGMSLVHYERAFEVPSELYLINWRNGKSEANYKNKSRHVTDMAFDGPSTAMLAAIERPGSMPQSPLPGKLKMLRAADMRSWIEMPVDYRASGTKAMLAVLDEKHAWVALDTGMILRLEP